MRPDYANLETGEIIEGSPDLGRTPLQIAKSELAAFKFKLIETITADPRMDSDCVSAMVVHMHFVSIDERTLKPTLAYASLTTMRARGNLRRTAAQQSRAKLVTEGYLIPQGAETKDGCIRFALANPKAERIDMHISEAMDHFREKAKDRKKEARRRARTKAEQDGVPEYGTPNEPWGVGKQQDGVPEYGTNYLREYLEGLGSGEEGLPIKVSSASSDTSLSAYALMKGGDPDQPLPIPANDDEGFAVLDDLLVGCEVGDAVRNYFHSKLMHGELTLSMLVEYRRAAA